MLKSAPAHMTKLIAIIQGHPDGNGSHIFVMRRPRAYARGAKEAGHDIKELVVAKLDFSVLHTKEEWEGGPVAPDIQHAQDAIRWADHLVIIWPLWLRGMPTLLKAFFEQVFRAGFAIPKIEPASLGWKTLLKGKSARIVVRWECRP